MIPLINITFLKSILFGIWNILKPRSVQLLLCRIISYWRWLAAKIFDEYHPSIVAPRAHLRAHMQIHQTNLWLQLMLCLRELNVIKTSPTTMYSRKPYRESIHFSASRAESWFVHYYNMIVWILKNLNNLRKIISDLPVACYAFLMWILNKSKNSHSYVSILYHVKKLNIFFFLWKCLIVMIGSASSMSNKP